MSRILQAKLSSVRRKHVVVAIATGVCAAVGAGVLCLAAGMLLDWWLTLSFISRAAILAVTEATLEIWRRRLAAGGGTRVIARPEGPAGSDDLGAPPLLK